MLFLISSIHAQGIATISQIKGGVLSGDFPLKNGDKLKEGDHILSMRSSSAKITLDDDTNIILGEESEINLKNHHSDKGSKKTLIKIIKGRIRVSVPRMILDHDLIEFSTPQLNLLVKASEFLVSSYTFGGSPSSDVLLIDGSLKITGAGFNSFKMKPAQYFNSQEFMRVGMKALKELSSKDFKFLKDNQLALMPDRDESGEIKDLNHSFKASKILLANSSRKSKPVIRNVVTKKKKSRSKTSVKGVLSFNYNLKREKGDILEAVVNRAKNRLANKCFYFMYLLDSKNKRVRKERKCDEYVYNL